MKIAEKIKARKASRSEMQYMLFLALVQLEKYEDTIDPNGDESFSVSDLADWLGEQT